jgi:hypothetical protein
LGDHPALCASKLKETRYFLDPDYPLISDVNFSNGFESYEKLFSECTDRNYRLEATPDYLYSTGCAERISKALPGCKLIFSLRDPINRLISWYKYSLQKGLLHNTVSFENYVAGQINLKTSDRTTPQHLRALEQGNYSKYLDSFYTYFKEEDIFIVQYNMLALNPRHVLEAVSSFIGIDPSFYEEYHFNIFNKSVKVRNPLIDSIYRRTKRVSKLINRQLPGGIFKAVKLTGRKIDRVYKSFNSDEWKIMKSDSQLYKKLQEYYAADQDILLKKFSGKISW